MGNTPAQGLHLVQGRDRRGKPFTATVEIRFRRMWIWPPAYKGEEAPKLLLTVIHAQERDAPKGREAIHCPCEGSLVLMRRFWGSLTAS